MRIEVALDSQGEFIKVDKNNLVKTVTIATLRPCRESVFLAFNKKTNELEMLGNSKMFWEFKTTRNAQKQISSIIRLNEQKIDDKCVISLVKHFKLCLGLGKKYAEHEVIIEPECKDFVDENGNYRLSIDDSLQNNVILSIS